MTSHPPPPPFQSKLPTIGRSWRSRLWMLIILLVAAAGFLASSPTRPLVPVTLRVDPNPPLVFGVIPFLGPRALKTRMEPLLTYLSRKLGRPVELNVASDYEALARLMDEERVSIAWFSHASYEHLGFGKPWKVICRPVQNDSVEYYGKIIVRADSPFRTLEDLKGGTFAYVERNSGSGFFFPNKLFTSLHIDPLRFFGKVVFTHSHVTSIEGVVRGLYDAAAVYTITPDSSTASMAELVRYIATTGPIPYDPLVARANLHEPLAASITAALLSMHLDPSAKGEVAQLHEWRGLNRFASEDEVQSLLSRPTVTTGGASGPANLPSPSAASETRHD
ncbi:phosphate/phosphite/phosphonate ABC transporter substrate-binding protein [Candidatus Ozemobacteraceae bacterium]|nr:phosphate/phosphite/phosphonate ABC transporter substrate-binding protein [Candidatus Ozemobacteraceae bacterium]